MSYAQTQKNMSTELGTGDGWDLQRQREALLMTVMTKMLKSNEQCERWLQEKEHFNKRAPLDDPGSMSNTPLSCCLRGLVW